MGRGPPLRLRAGERNWKKVERRHTGWGMIRLVRGLAILLEAWLARRHWAGRGRPSAGRPAAGAARLRARACTGGWQQQGRQQAMPSHMGMDKPLPWRKTMGLASRRGQYLALSTLHGWGCSVKRQAARRQVVPARAFAGRRRLPV